MRSVDPAAGSEDASAAIPRQDSEHHGRTRTATPAGRRALGGLLPRRGRAPVSAGCPSPTSASPRSTTTAACARACPKPSTARARRPSSARPSWVSCSRAGRRRPGHPHPGRRRARSSWPWPTTRRGPHRHRVGHRGRSGPGRAVHRGLAAGAAPTGPHPGGHRRHLRPPGGPRVRGHPHRPRAAARPCWPTAGWPASTGCWPRPTSWPTPTPWSWWPGWRGRWPAWSGASPRPRWWPCPPAPGYGAALEGVTALLAMHASCAAGITVVGIDNGFGAACAVARMLP